jgi:hypothetical protein
MPPVEFLPGVIGRAEPPGVIAEKEFLGVLLKLMGVLVADGVLVAEGVLVAKDFTCWKWHERACQVV